MQVPVYDMKGSEIDQIELDDSVFGLPMNEAVVHQAMVRQLANARVGTSSTKSRGEVSGSTRKLYRQKHTGRARAGSIRSPLRRHGGVIFGPKPRDYRQDMPKKMRRLAIKCLLSAKATDGNLKVLDKLEIENPKTQEMIQILQALDVDRSALIAISSPDPSIIKSANNIRGNNVIQARQLNVVDLLNHKHLIITRESVEIIGKLWGKKEAVTA